MKQAYLYKERNWKMNQDSKITQLVAEQNNLNFYKISGSSCEHSWTKLNSTHLQVTKANWNLPEKGKQFLMKTYMARLFNC